MIMIHEFRVGDIDVYYILCDDCEGDNDTDDNDNDGDDGYVDDHDEK